MIKTEFLELKYRNLSSLIKEEINPDGFWTGRLSSSALSTAVAIVAIKINGNEEAETRIAQGLQWLFENVNSDGGYGDTSESESNVSTTFLSYAAIHYCGGAHPKSVKVIAGIKQYLISQKISLEPDKLTSSVLAYYGKDYTFSVPILSMLVICGILDEKACYRIPQLPFEFTLLPASWYSFFNMQVVSYAIPALVAVGIFIFKKRTRHNPLFKLIRNKAIKPSLKKLSSMVPQSGGFLEAIPLTAFVSMCLISSETDCQEVVVPGICFLENQQRADGSWPIDTDLSTWVTTLTVKAFGLKFKEVFDEKEIIKLREHLLEIQCREKHPFNGAAPGGWGWTNYNGSVPDADDTPGAILALLELYQGSSGETQAIIDGCVWLTRLQNRDGGFPTFCKGWGRLPFDSSCADLTGHALTAVAIVLDKIGEKLSSQQKIQMENCVNKATRYLYKAQFPDGSWLPLWFGNQMVSGKINPVYGTAKVSIYLETALQSSHLSTEIKYTIQSMLKKAGKYLLSAQNTDGSWGGSKGIPGSIEETSLAISALAKTHKDDCLKGFAWLEEQTSTKGIWSSPIGLYFATLWYDEKMYPKVYYAEALRRFLY